MAGNQNMQNDSSKTIKLILAIGLVIAALIASAGVFYYYAIFAPNLERERIELEKQQREEELAQQVKLQEELNRKEALETCLNTVEEEYVNVWSDSCIQQSERNKKMLLICNNSFANPSDCQIRYGDIQHNPKCILPTAVATVIENKKAEYQEQCNREFSKT